MSSLIWISRFPLQRNFLATLACAIAFCGVSCGHSHGLAPVDTRTVMESVRDYGKGRAVTTASVRQIGAVQQGSPTTTAASGADDEDTWAYRSHVALIMAEDHFDQLEKEAQQARASKSRLQDGIWKLASFYPAVSYPPSGKDTTDKDWKTHFETIHKWIAAYPESATARIALAEAYANYAWAARGTGYADKVSSDGWALFGERIEMAKSALVEAAKLKERCPEWYSVMLDVATAEGWDKEQEKELFERATAFNPGYSDYYTKYASYLLPKWHGEEGDTQALAESASNQIGGIEGNIIYYDIGSLLACQCDDDKNTLEGMDWRKLKQGYLDLEKAYGVSNYESNRFAYMAYRAGDKAAAQGVFEKIGNVWYPWVWKNKENFESAKGWATGS